MDRSQHRPRHISFVAIPGSTNTESKAALAMTTAEEALAEAGVSAVAIATQPFWDLESPQLQHGQRFDPREYRWRFAGPMGQMRVPKHIPPGILPQGSITVVDSDLNWFHPDPCYGQDQCWVVALKEV